MKLIERKGFPCEYELIDEHGTHLSFLTELTLRELHQLLTDKVNELDGTETITAEIPSDVAGRAFSFLIEAGLRQYLVENDSIAADEGEASGVRDQDD